MVIFNIMMDMLLKYKSFKLDKKKNLENLCGILYLMYI